MTPQKFHPLKGGGDSQWILVDQTTSKGGEGWVDAGALLATTCDLLAFALLIVAVASLPEMRLDLLGRAGLGMINHALLNPNKAIRWSKFGLKFGFKIWFESK